MRALGAVGLRAEMLRDLGGFVFSAEGFRVLQWLSGGDVVCRPRQRA